MRQLLWYFAWWELILVLPFALCACTFKLDPTVDVQCVEIDYPFQHVTLCDGGVVQPPPKASDAGHDSGG